MSFHLKLHTPIHKQLKKLSGSLGTTTGSIDKRSMTSKMIKRNNPNLVVFYSYTLWLAILRASQYSRDAQTCSQVWGFGIYIDMPKR